MRFILFAAIATCCMGEIKAQTLERPVASARSYAAERERSLRAKDQEIVIYVGRYRQAEENYRAHPGDLTAQMTAAGQHIELLKVLLDREEIETDYLKKEARAASDLADALTQQLPDGQIQAQVNQLSERLQESKGRIRDLLGAIGDSDDTAAKRRLEEAVMRAEQLQSSLNVFERIEQRAAKSADERMERVGRLRSAVVGAERAAESHSYRVIAIKATMAGRMLDLHSANEEVKTRALSEELQQIVGDTSGRAFDEYVIKMPTNSRGTVEQRARRVLDGSTRSTGSDPVAVRAKDGSEQ